MAPLSSQHRRTHNLLLVSKLLDHRDTVSPFTLILDSLEQSARPFIAEKLRRKSTGNGTIIFVSFETIRKPANVDHFVEAWREELQIWQQDLARLLKDQVNQKKTLIFDSLNPLSAQVGSRLPALLSGFIGPNTSLFAVYHSDWPSGDTIDNSASPYSPSTLTLLRYVATSIVTTHSLPHVLSRKAARDRSHAEPSFGLEENVDGILQGLRSNDSEGIVLEIEHRRKSGRGVRERYVLWLDSNSPVGSRSSKSSMTLLEDHPAYKERESANISGLEGDTGSSTFELGLTEKQRLDREGVVLPYFDAQNGGGDGGRILYDMGEDDDFDEEEDEI